MTLQEKRERSLKSIEKSTDVEALRDVRSMVEGAYKTMPAEGKEDLHVLFHAVNNRIEELLK